MFDSTPPGDIPLVYHSHYYLYTDKTLSFEGLFLPPYVLEICTDGFKCCCL